MPSSVPRVTMVEAEPVIRMPWQRLVLRALRRQCPVCGFRQIWNSWIGIKDSCPNCKYTFVRENGYFLGAMLLTVIFSELFVMGLMILMLVFTDMIWCKVELIILPLALL